MSTYEVLFEDDEKVIVKDRSLNNMSITLTKEEFERWKAIKDKVVSSYE